MNSALIWRGPSRLTGEPIAVVLSGLQRSTNRKTGNAVQVYILVDRAQPNLAAKDGRDAAICGDCPRRRTPERGTTCYVNTAFMGGLAQAMHRPPITVAEALDACRGRFVRLGAYGDPAAAPLYLWWSLCEVASGWTGYTHQWRSQPAYRHFCMASVESPGERQEAKRLGWRTFRIRRPATEPLFSRDPDPLRQSYGGEVVCPASEEAGKRTTCERCLLCSGLESGGRDVAIIDHSVKARWARSKLRVVQ